MSELPSIPATWLTLLGIAASSYLVWNAIRAGRVDTQLNEKVQESRERAEKYPDKAVPAWDYAQSTFHKYFWQNLNQVKWIFFFAVFVMLAGFGVILYGVTLALDPKREVEPARLSALSGIVTEFIAATFMWIYRSTMQQASGFMAILDRINTVGMAVQVLDSMPGGDDPQSLKNKTRAHLVELLMARRVSSGRELQTPEVQRSPRKRSRKAAAPGEPPAD